MRAITIQLDLNYRDLRAMQYHPDAGWLKEHGYSEQLAKCPHIPEVEDFLSPEENLRMPCVVLHQLAHGFHDQTIGFDDARVIAAWNKFPRQLGIPVRPHDLRPDARALRPDGPEGVLRRDDRVYFGSNDFYPFVAGELKQAEPETFALLAEIWGPLPGSAPSKPEAKTMNHNPAFDSIMKRTLSSLAIVAWMAISPLGGAMGCL